MHKIYFRDNVLILDDDATRYCGEDYTGIGRDSALPDRTKLLQNLQNIIAQNTPVETDPVFTGWRSSDRIELGNSSFSQDEGGIAIGSYNEVYNTSIAIGSNARCYEDNALTIGYDNGDAGINSITIGANNLNENGVNQNNTSIGIINSLIGEDIINIGSHGAIYNNSVNVGNYNHVGPDSIIIGHNISCPCDPNVEPNAFETKERVTAIGHNIQIFEDDQILIGDDIDMDDYYAKVSPQAGGCILAIKKRGEYILAIDSEYNVYVPRGNGDPTMVCMTAAFDTVGF